MKLFVLNYQAALYATTRGVPLGTFNPVFIFEDDGRQRPTSLAQWIADALEEGRMTNVDAAESPGRLAQAIRTPYEVNEDRCLLATAIEEITAVDGWQERVRAVAQQHGVVLAFTADHIVDFLRSNVGR